SHARSPRCRPSDPRRPTDRTSTRPRPQAEVRRLASTRNLLEPAHQGAGEANPLVVIAVVGVEMDLAHTGARLGGDGRYDRVIRGTEAVVRGDEEQGMPRERVRLTAQVQAGPVTQRLVGEVLGSSVQQLHPADVDPAVQIFDEV